jgi:signal transduction histidine kinase
MRVASDVSEPKLKSYLTESRIGAMRMVHIIGDLLEFSRSSEGEFNETDINELVEQAVSNRMSAAEAERVVVAVDFQTQEMPAVYGSRLYQVCCNLIKNAIEAMPDGGQLTVTTGIANGDAVIRVADTGVGLPTPTQKVFQPFFTTKGPGKGTGLGLAICKDFVEEMQGTITAEPGDVCGSVFTVRIPLSSCHRPSPIAKSVRPDTLDVVEASHDQRGTQQGP